MWHWSPLRHSPETSSHLPPSALSFQRFFRRLSTFVYMLATTLQLQLQLQHGSACDVAAILATSVAILCDEKVTEEKASHALQRKALPAAVTPSPRQCLALQHQSPRSSRRRYHQSHRQSIIQSQSVGERAGGPSRTRGRTHSFDCGAVEGKKKWQMLAPPAA